MPHLPVRQRIRYTIKPNEIRNTINQFILSMTMTNHPPADEFTN